MPNPALPAPALPDKAVILLWHEHLPVCIRAFAGLGIHVLISRSNDGAWAAEACERFGFRVHRGSSSRGFMEGMRALARAMEAGTALAGMALDGPRGPRRAVKAGSLWLARSAGAPVIPVWAEAAPAFRLKSWDRSVIPLPFAKVVIHIGPPVFPSTTEELQKAMADAENSARSAEDLATAKS